MLAFIVFFFYRVICLDKNTRFLSLLVGGPAYVILDSLQLVMVELFN